MLNVSGQMRVNDKRDVGIAERFQVIDIVDDVTLQKFAAKHRCRLEWPRSSFYHVIFTLTKRISAPQTKISEGLTKEEIRIFVLLFNGS